MNETKDLIRTLQTAIAKSEWFEVALSVETASEILAVLRDYEKSVKITDETLKMLETHHNAP